MNSPLGLYIHIPFCKAKCSYCDFYSFAPKKGEIRAYIRSLAKHFSDLKCYYNDRTFQSVYIGGGTPSLLGEDIIPLMDSVRENFNILPTAEITAEVNPESADLFLPHAKKAGVNRISLGCQTASNATLKALGRLHTAEDIKRAVALSRDLGLSNISGDLMIALPNSDISSLDNDIDFLLSLKVPHISAYILKAEKGTPLYLSGTALPDDDAAADFYLHTCNRLKAAGFNHYEISNFAKSGFEGRHNLNYWRCGEYLGIGPAAHSFVNGRRFYYSRDIGSFLNFVPPVDDGTGGTVTEKFMLGLRLKSGVKISDYPFLQTASAKEKIARFEDAGLLEPDRDRLSLTDKGFLLSNYIITELTDENL